MKNKKLILAASLLAAAFTTTGVTLAFLTTKTEEVVNTFTPSEVKIGIDEPDWQDGKTVKEKVSIENTGDTEAYIRAAIVVNWYNESDNTIYGEIPEEGEGKDYTLSLNTAGWIEHGGYYYWTKPVPVEDNPNTQEDEDNTGILIEECKVIGTAPADGYVLRVDVLAQAVQSTPVTAIEDLWGKNIDFTIDTTTGKITNITTP